MFCLKKLLSHLDTCKFAANWEKEVFIEMLLVFYDIQLTPINILKFSNITIYIIYSHAPPIKSKTFSTNACTHHTPSSLLINLNILKQSKYYSLIQVHCHHGWSILRMDLYTCK